jgi:hypothetical protein
MENGGICRFREENEKKFEIPEFAPAKRRISDAGVE